MPDEFPRLPFGDHWQPEPKNPGTPMEQWRAFTGQHLAELLVDSLAYAMAEAASRALTAQQSEIARLHAELDRYQGRTVFHCTDTQVLTAMVALKGDTSVKRGDILRATDTGKEFEFDGEGQGWVPRA